MKNHTISLIISLILLKSFTSPVEYEKKVKSIGFIQDLLSWSISTGWAIMTMKYTNLRTMAKMTAVQEMTTSLESTPI